MQQSAPIYAGLVIVVGLSATACREVPAGGGATPAGITPSPSLPSLLEEPIMTLAPEPPNADMELAGEPTGPCDHLLWPLRDGASWTYQAADGSQVILTSTITGAGVLLSAGEQSSLLNCLDGALAGLLPGPFGAGHPALGYGLQGLNPTGSLLPAPALLLPLGTSSNWDMGIDAAGTIRLPGSMQDMSLPVLGGKIVVYSSTQALDTITVLAGTFSALPLNQQVFYDIGVGLPDGVRQQVIISTATRLYFVERLGLIKVVFEGGTVSTPAGTSVLESGPTLELMSYTIP